MSNLDKPVEKYKPYVHWTYPDSKFQDNPDPSYMMARKLNRKTRPQAKLKPVEDSFAVKVQTDYDTSSIPTSIVQAPVSPVASSKTPNMKSKKRKRHPEQPLTPKRPKTAFMVFLNNEKERLQSKNVKISMPELSKVVSQHWKNLPLETKAPFEEQSKLMRQSYEQELKIHKMKMKEFVQNHPDWDLNQAKEDSKKKKKTKLGYKDLFNKVVKLNKQGQREAGAEFQYYYVLTYIPDLFWCHLAPLRAVGVFGPHRKKVEGRTKWMLVHEGEGKELDITGAVCEVVKSRVMKGCDDADKEEWDIMDPEAQLSRTNDKDEKSPQIPISAETNSSAKTTAIVFPPTSTVSISEGSSNKSTDHKSEAALEQISESECSSSEAGVDVPFEPSLPVTNVEQLITPIVVDTNPDKIEPRAILDCVQTSLSAFFKK